MRYLKWLASRLSGPRAAIAVIALAVVLVLPALFSPLFVDEYAQTARWRAAFSGASPPGLGSFLNRCFVFGDGTLQAHQYELEFGFGTWWASPDFKIAFWRPLTAVTHAIDFALWPDNAVLMHLHTLAWFVALLVALKALFQRLLPPRVAMLALALYAWDDARGHVLSWVAKRNALIAALLGICALLAYDRWRRDRWWPGALLVPALLGLSLLSAEVGVCTTAYLFAYAWCLDRGPLAKRLVALVPSAAVVVLWRIVYVAAGYGAAGTVGYIDPFRQPLAYVSRLLEHAPILALGQLTPFWSDFWALYPPPVKVGVYLLALVTLLAIAWVGWSRLAADPLARFWVLGGGLSLAPVAITGPSDQNLVFVGIGAAGALALLFASALSSVPTARLPRILVGTMAVCHLALAPLLLPLRSLTVLGMAYGLPLTEASIPKEARIGGKTLVVVSTITEGGVYASLNRRYAKGIPRPRRSRILALSFDDVSITRLDAQTLRVRPQHGFLDSVVHQLMRDPSRPFRQGEVIELADMSATVTELTSDHRPLTVDFHFSAPLGSPQWLWMRGEGARLVEWPLPAVGEEVVVPGL